MQVNNVNYRRFSVSDEIRQGLEDYEFYREDEIEGELIALALEDYMTITAQRMEIMRYCYYTSHTPAARRYFAAAVVRLERKRQAYEDELARLNDTPSWFAS